MVITADHIHLHTGGSAVSQSQFEPTRSNGEPEEVGLFYEMMESPDIRHRQPAFLAAGLTLLYLGMAFALRGMRAFAFDGDLSSARLTSVYGAVAAGLLTYISAFAYVNAEAIINAIRKEELESFQRDVTEIVETGAGALFGSIVVLLAWISPTLGRFAMFAMIIVFGIIVFLDADEKSLRHNVDDMVLVALIGGSFGVPIALFMGSMVGVFAAFCVIIVGYGAVKVKSIKN